MTAQTHTSKPRLRGYVHQEAFFISLGACALLIAKSSSGTALLASIVYSLGLLMLFGISATYHRPYWAPAARAIMKRFDHCAIFLQIAGSFTPICLLALPAEVGNKLLLIIWSAAVLGIFQSIFWSKAPRWVTAIFYVVMGWLALPYLGELKVTLGFNYLMLLAAGGVIYTIGAVIYAIKKPNLFPGTFGYHELFHVLTIIAAALHFIVIYQLIQ
ncbi:MAG: PAQR family membrane homeostasis protein TrhA [Pseudobdellovibrionaceae bacterium]